MKRKKLLTVSEYVDGIKSGDRFILSRAITLIESNKIAHRELAQEILSKCQESNQTSFRIGITGSPGVGKSTFIEKIGSSLIERGHRLAILTIDPSSQITKGSILGDKTRMNVLSASENAFVRPSPSSGTLGGVARNTRETILLCEAAGYDMVFVETVGVGQSEIAVHYMTDLFLLLLLPGAGDELQGIKKGVVEMADLLIVNKSDGDREKLAQLTRRSYVNALRLFPLKDKDSRPDVYTCSAINGNGIPEVMDALEAYAKQTDVINKNRLEQDKYWLRQSIESGLISSFFDHPLLKEELAKEEQSILEGKTSPFLAAERLLRLFEKRSK